MVIIHLFLFELLLALSTELLDTAFAFTALSEPYTQEVYSQTECDMDHRARADFNFEKDLAVGDLLIEFAMHINVLQLYCKDT